MTFKTVHMGKIIKQELTDRRMTIKKFSDLLGINYINTRKMLSKTDLRPKMLRAISKILEVDLFQHLLSDGTTIGNSADKQEVQSPISADQQKVETLQKENALLREINQLLRDKLESRA